MVDCGYHIFKEKVSRYFSQSVAGLPFPLPFSFIVDKDQSHHRKRALVGIRVINLEPESMGTLVDKVYVGHPASIDQSGEGIARTVHSLLLDIGVNQQHMGRSYRGLCADGGILNVNLSDHLLQLCWGTSVIPESKRGKVIWVWDGAHIIELILDHSLAAFPVLKDSKDRLASLTKFFREPSVYEILRQKGLDSDQRLYTPKVAKEMKLVAHDATIAHDLVSNFNLYVETLQHLINNSTKDELIAEATGHLAELTNESFL